MMRRRGRPKALMFDPARGAAAAAREALERKWRSRLEDRPDLARWVTAESAQREPFHRWIHYAQGFAPEFVRQFLTEQRGPADAHRPVLDPFAGSGTVAIECARRGVPAVAVETVEALAFIGRTMSEPEWPAFPPIEPGIDDWRAIAERLEAPLHRAALMLAVARQHTSAGRQNRGARPLRLLLEEVVGLMRDDLRKPLQERNEFLCGDARRLALEDASVDAILTSPPYLSRHDYAQITKPLEMTHSFWYGQSPAAQLPAMASAARQQRSARAAARSGLPDRASTHPAVEEAAAALESAGEPRLARVVQHYFADLFKALGESRRVLRTRGICWWVLGGARLKGVYVPSDLIAAEVAESLGWRIAELRVARRLIDVGRKLGGLLNVAPRETVIVMRPAE